MKIDELALMYCEMLKRMPPAWAYWGEFNSLLIEKYGQAKFMRVKKLAWQIAKD